MIVQGVSLFEDRKESIVSHIINSIRLVLPGKLLSIDENSEQLFYDYIKLSCIDCSAFSYNWPYIIQATRGSGFYYHKNKAIVYFYLRENPNSLRRYTLVVVNHLGQDSEAAVCEISEAAKKLNITSIIKNVDKDKVLLWEKFGYKETVEPWSQYSFRDDNTCPEFVYNITNIMNLEFSRRTRSIIKKISKENKYNLIHYNDSFKDGGLKLLEKNSEYLEAKGVDFKKEVILAHNFVFDENIKNKAVFSVLEDRKLIAISYLTHVGDNLFFNAIINENKPNLMRFLLWKVVAQYCSGLEEKKRPLYLALQGSENNGQNQWKFFFNPERTIQRTHVTNDIKKCLTL